ncbi:Hypothetical protein NTJ_07504 [Nesidiocoris tenuis]|uniref:Uncharacterized protein n=1 Tax=Nesidiocoris tenuis TaxID=355587 RepID=A0ABN7AUT9_9HEMI|nr:Hypothetical protein NTJ_07504 [Nesidiocoris tenuis]
MLLFIQPAHGLAVNPDGLRLSRPPVDRIVVFLIRLRPSSSLAKEKPEPCQTLLSVEDADRRYSLPYMPVSHERQPATDADLPPYKMVLSVVTAFWSRAN